MADLPISLPENDAELRAFTTMLLAEYKAQAMLVAKLRHQLAGARAHRFGASSERIDQLNLALEANEIAIARLTAAADRNDLPEADTSDKPRRKPVPRHVSRQTVELSVDSSSGCEDCGGDLRQIGEDVTEELDYVPGRFVVNRIVRPRMVCSCCERFVQAPLPSRPIERGRPGSGLLAHVLVSKYADHLPLYRQSDIYEREGLDLNRSTLADWTGKCGALLEPLADAIGRHVLAGDAIFADDTSVSMLAPREPARHAPPGFGLMDVMSAPGAAMRHRRVGIASHPIAKAFTPETISRALKAGCMLTAMPVLKSFTVLAPSRKWPAWRTSSASSSISTKPKGPPLPKRRSHGLQNSMA